MNEMLQHSSANWIGSSKQMHNGINAIITYILLNENLLGS